MEKFEMSFEWDDKESAYYERVRGNVNCTSFKQVGLIKTVRMEGESEEGYYKRTLEFVARREEVFNNSIGVPIHILEFKFS